MEEEAEAAAEAAEVEVEEEDGEETAAEVGTTRRAVGNTTIATIDSALAADQEEVEVEAEAAYKRNDTGLREVRWPSARTASRPSQTCPRT